MQKAYMAWVRAAGLDSVIGGSGGTIGGGIDGD